jgi:hypothetical protein
MTNQPPSKSQDDPEVWEQILRDEGLPSEPSPQRGAVPLPSDASADFGDQRSLLERESGTIFEAGQKWKQVSAFRLVCEFCGCGFTERAGTKYCCSDHRKRHAEGKVYVKVLCEQNGCSKEISFGQESYVVDGKTFCWLCFTLHKMGFNSYEEYRANYDAKHEEYLLTRKRQAEQERKMRLGEL